MFIQTYTGVKFDLQNPETSMVNLEDIAHALSQINRYTGHTKEPYTVGEHSITMCLAFKYRGHVQLAREALMHDAHEAYVGDLSYPAKMVLGELWAPFEERVANVVRDRFDLPRTISDRVKTLDRAILAVEKELFMANVDWSWGELPAVEFDTLHVYRDPKRAKEDFLTLAEELGIK